MVILLASLALLPSQSPVLLSDARLRTLDTFVSNFAEARTEPFGEGRLTDSFLADFVVSHAIHNGVRSFEAPAEDSTRMLDRSEADRITLRYFAQRILNHTEQQLRIRKAYTADGTTVGPTSGYYIFTGLEGEYASNIGRVFRVEGNFPSSFKIFGVEYETEKPEKSSDWRAVRFGVYQTEASAKEKGRFILKSLRYVSAAKMRELTGLSKFPLPRWRYQ